MTEALTLNKITSQKGISISEATRLIADLGWTPSYVQDAMHFPTDYKISKPPRDPVHDDWDYCVEENKFYVDKGEGRIVPLAAI